MPRKTCATGAPIAAGMNACVGAGRISEATSILETMKVSGLRPDVRAYNTLLKGLAAGKDMEAMEALLEEMREGQIGASVVTYNIVVDAFAKKGRLKEVCTPLNSLAQSAKHMLAPKQHVRGCNAQTAFLSRIIDCQAFACW